VETASEWLGWGKMRFLTGSELNSEISSILREQGCRCAVAFWGKGAEDKLHLKGKGDYRVICNLSAGGTNPEVIEKLNRVNIRQCDTLHAKVYIGSNAAIVTSANASINGIGLEGKEQEKWIEAGLLVKSSPELTDWFDKLWEKSRPISDEDLERAKKLWARRSRPFPPIPDIDDTRDDLPLVTWLPEREDRQWEITQQYRGKGMDDLLEIGISAVPADRNYIVPGLWIVVWFRRESDGMPSQELRPYFFYTGQYLKRAWCCVEDQIFLDWILPSPNEPPAPFDFEDQAALKAFERVISRASYEKLRTETYRGSWYSEPRKSLMRRFWSDFKSEYGAVSVSEHAAEGRG
jgi:hypothetical protein